MRRREQKQIRPEKLVTVGTNRPVEGRLAVEKGPERMKIMQTVEGVALALTVDQFRDRDPGHALLNEEAHPTPRGERRVEALASLKKDGKKLDVKEG